MNQIEYWRWKHRDPRTGQVLRTDRQMTAEEAAALCDAERIPGTMRVREVVPPEAQGQQAADARGAEFHR